jgi:hypothetical protein
LARGGRPDFELVMRLVLDGQRNRRWHGWRSEVTAMVMGGGLR